MTAISRYRNAIVTVLITAVGLAGCAPALKLDEVTGTIGEPPVSSARLPSVVKPYARMVDALSCIRMSGVLRGKTFVVGSFADSTGKINAVAPGATGNFLPQGGSAAYIISALTQAGARVVSTYFGAPGEKVPANYAINGIFNSLDFGQSASADLRVAGIGPQAFFGWAQLSLSIQLDEAATRVNRQMSMVQRPVRFTAVGLSVGRSFGDTLVTGMAGVQNQERLQLEALNGPIALGVIDVVLKEFPAARSQCDRIVADLLDSKVAMVGG